jgi:hypothetical protein
LFENGLLIVINAYTEGVLFEGRDNAMPFQIDWYVPDRVIYWQEYGTLKVEELYQEHEVIGGVLSEYANGSLYLLLDHRDLEFRPPDVPAIRQVLEVFSHPALRHTVVIGDNHPAWRFLAEAIRKFTNAQVQVVRDFEEARQFLVQEGVSLKAYTE